MPSGNSNHLRTYTVLRGGIAIHNPNSVPNLPGGAYGTLGFIATSNGIDRWAVSCYHVLCRKGADFPADTTESIYHPVSQFQQTPVATVSNRRIDRSLDCAAAELIVPGAAMPEILGIGRLSAPAEPTIGMRVLKAGAETGVTEGHVVRLFEKEFEIAPVHMPDDYDLTEGGDSGSLWVDAATMAPVGLHYRGNDRGTPERAFARRITLVLSALTLHLP